MSGKQRDIAFVIGAGRSGSTLLYKLLCLHADVAFINNYDIRLPLAVSNWVTRRFDDQAERKRAAWFNDSGNAYFVSRPLQKRFFPTPVEGETIYQRSGVPLFPEPDYLPDERTIDRMRQNFDSICERQSRQLLVSKRTANNRRIGTLRKVFPEARFVHLVRDGRDVAHSLSNVEWWPEHTVWWDGRKAKDMEASGIDRLQICARNWVKETELVLNGLNEIARQRILTVNYEGLMREPRATMDAVCEFLGLAASADYLQIIDSVGLEPRESGWPARWSDEQKSLVEYEQRGLLAELGYTG